MGAYLYAIKYCTIQPMMKSGIFLRLRKKRSFHKLRPHTDDSGNNHYISLINPSAISGDITSPCPGYTLLIRPPSSNFSSKGTVTLRYSFLLLPGNFTIRLFSSTVSPTNSMSSSTMQLLPAEWPGTENNSTSCPTQRNAY